MGKTTRRNITYRCVLFYHAVVILDRVPARTWYQLLGQKCNKSNMATYTLV